MTVSELVHVAHLEPLRSASIFARGAYEAGGGSDVACQGPADRQVPDEVRQRSNLLPSSIVAARIPRGWMTAYCSRQILTCMCNEMRIFE